MSPYSILFSSLLVVITALDIGTFRYPILGKWGVALWIVSYVLMGIFALLCLLYLFKLLIKRKSIITLFIIILYISIIGMNLTSDKNVSGEATQEINCTLNLLLHAPDAGFHQTCLFGYPTAQFLLPALPSLIMGRSALALNLGGSLYFILGLLIFSSGILKYHKNTLKGDLISGLVLSLIFHIHFVNHFLFYFEQSIFPFSFGLMLIGLYFHFLSERKTEVLFLAGFVLLYITKAYTPAITLFILAIGALLYLICSKKYLKREIIIFAFLMAVSSVSFLASIQYRGDLVLKQTETKTISQMAADLGDAFDQIVYERDGTPYLSAAANSIFILLIPLLFIINWRYAALAVWILFSVVLSVVLKGFAYYAIDFRIHRTIVVFPVIFAVMAVLLGKLDLAGMKRYLIVLIFIILTTGLIFQKSYFDSKSPNPHYAFFEWLVGKAGKNVFADSKKFYFIGEAHPEMSPIYDELQYFLPQMGNWGISETEINEDCSLPIIDKGILLVPLSYRCTFDFKRTENHPRLKPIGEYKTWNNLDVAVFEVD